MTQYMVSLGWTLMDELVCRYTDYYTFQRTTYAGITSPRLRAPLVALRTHR
jgi:hypothetical protein